LIGVPKHYAEDGRIDWVDIISFWIRDRSPESAEVGVSGGEIDISSTEVIRSAKILRMWPLAAPARVIWRRSPEIQ
jgi:hypothetical protein